MDFLNNFLKFLFQKIELLIISFFPHIILYFKNPTYKTLKTIFIYKDDFLRSLPPKEREKFETFAIKRFPRLFRYIFAPSLELQLLIIELDLGYISYINRPQYETQLAVIKKNSNYFKYIRNKDYRIQLEAVKMNCWNIKFVDYSQLTFKQQKRIELEAVKWSGELIDLIKNPCVEVQIAAIKENKEAIYYIFEIYLETYLEFYKIYNSEPYMLDTFNIENMKISRKCIQENIELIIKERLYYSLERNKEFKRLYNKNISNINNLKLILVNSILKEKCILFPPELSYLISKRILNYNA